MKKIASFLFVFFCVIATTFAQEQTTITRFEGKKITGIISHGAFDITITQGTSTKATVNIPARLESKLKFSLDSDGILSKDECIMKKMIVTRRKSCVRP